MRKKLMEIIGSEWKIEWKWMGMKGMNGMNRMNRMNGMHGMHGNERKRMGINGNEWNE